MTIASMIMESLDAALGDLTAIPAELEPIVTQITMEAALAENTPAKRVEHETNISHLLAQATIVLATIEIREAREARELVKRVFIGVVSSALHSTGLGSVDALLKAIL